MSEQVKQEGDFKLKSKPKQLAKKDEQVTKVNIKESLVQLPPDVTKVVIPKEELKIEDNAVQEPNSESSVLRSEQPEVGLQEVGREETKGALKMVKNLTQSKKFHKK
jgi:stress response protein YsnF